MAANGGRTINLCEFTDFDFVNLGTGATGCVIWLAQNIPIAPYSEGRLAIAFRSVNIAAAASTVKFDLIPVSVRWDDPTRFYRDLNKPLPSVAISQGQTAGALAGVYLNKELALASGEPLPNLASLRMTVVQGTALNALNFTLAVDLQLKMC